MANYGKAYLILDYLDRLPVYKGKTSSEILDYLFANSYWGWDKQSGQGCDIEALKERELRNLQNLLKAMANDSEIARFLIREPSGKGKQLNYRIDREQRLQQTMEIGEALTLRLAEQFLQHALPVEFLEGSLNILFRAARERIRAHEAGPAGSNQAVRQFIQRIAISQRGQQLVSLPSQVPVAQLGVVSQAILERRQLNCSYRNHNKTLHPYGIVIREPKIYLLAVEDHVLRKLGAENVEPRQYLCNRIENPQISELRNAVPDNFDAMAYVATGKLDVQLGKNIGLSDRPFTLVLKVISRQDNLITDLTEYPLSSTQTLEQVDDSNNYILEAGNMRLTYPLLEWIMARMDRVEVISPTALRNHMQRKVAAMHSIYSG